MEPASAKGGTIPLATQLVPDGALDSCMRCRKDFSMWIRKHHCKFCGNLLCDDCSSFRIEIRRSENVTGSLFRSCESCFSWYSNQQQALADARQAEALLLSTTPAPTRARTHSLDSSHSSSNRHNRARSSTSSSTPAHIRQQAAQSQGHRRKSLRSAMRHRRGSQGTVSEAGSQKPECSFDVLQNAQASSDADSGQGMEDILSSDSEADEGAEAAEADLAVDDLETAFDDVHFKEEVVRRKRTDPMRSLPLSAFSWLPPPKKAGRAQDLPTNTFAQQRDEERETEVTTSIPFYGGYVEATFAEGDEVLYVASSQTPPEVATVLTVHWDDHPNAYYTVRIHSTNKERQTDDKHLRPIIS